MNIQTADRIITALSALGGLALLAAAPVVFAGFWYAS